MFTGIVEETGKVLDFAEGHDAWKLRVGTQRVAGGLALGDSVAVNGCCLTVVALRDGEIAFDLLEETVRLTAFDLLRDRSRSIGWVNLERSLPAEGRLGGHFVSGHVDGTGRVSVFEARGKNHYLRVEPPPQFLKYLVYKGSIAIDGISLTVADVDGSGFGVWLIPHTLTVTNLHERRVGDSVNLEFDLLAKYVEKLLQGRDTLAQP